MTAAPRWPRRLLFSHRGVAHPAALLACNLVYPMCLSAHPVAHRFSRGTDKDGQTAGDERRKRKGKGTGPYRLSGMDGLPNSRVLQKIRDCPSDRFLGLAPLGRLPASAFDLPPQSWHSPGILQTGRPTDGTDRDKSVGRQGRDAQNCSCKLAAPLQNHCSGSHPRRSPEPLPSDAPSLLLLPSPSLLLLSHRKPPQYATTIARSGMRNGGIRDAGNVARNEGI